MPSSKPKEQKTDTSFTELTQAMMVANPKVMEAWLDLMNDSARFVADRLEKDQETQKALLNCKTPTELIEVQSKFFRDAVEQYTAQTTKIFEKMSKATKTAMDETTLKLSRSYDDVPL
jgi:phasin family protein